jgi:putative ABC transport system permease protein
VKRSRLSRKLFLIAILVAVIGFAAVFIIFPDYKVLIYSFFSTLPDQLRPAVLLLSAPMLKVLSLFGIIIPKEVAALLTVGLTVSIVFFVIQFTRSSFTKIAIRNIPRRKLRNGLTVLAIVLGVALIVGINVAFDSIHAQFEEMVNLATGSVDITISTLEDTPFDENVLATVRDTDGVAQASARVNSFAAVSESGGELEGEWEIATIIGVDSRSDFDYLESVNITRKLEFLRLHIELEVDSYQAVVDEGFNYDIGDTFRVYMITDLNINDELDQVEETNQTKLFWFTVVGIHHPIETSMGYGGNSIYIDRVTAQRIGDYVGKVNSVIVKVADIERTNSVVRKLNSRLGLNYVISPIKNSLLNTMTETTSGLNSGLQVMSVMGLCVAIVIVLNTVYMNVGERTREVGTLRSIGTSTRQVFWMFFSESIIFGIIGVVLGIVAGILMTTFFQYLTSRTFQPFMVQEFTVIKLPQLQHLILGAVTGILTTVVGGLFPSLIASRKNVVETLRPSMRKAGKSRTALKLIAIGLPMTVVGVSIYLWGAYFEQVNLGILYASLLAPVPVIGVILLVAGLLRSANPVVEHVLILFGNTRKIISRNIDRNLVRSTACFALTGLSMSFIIVMGAAQTGVVMGVEEVIYAFTTSDLTVFSETRISRSFANDLTNLDASITRTTPVLIIPQRNKLVNNASSTQASTTIMAIDPTSYSEVMTMRFSEDTPSNVFAELDQSGRIILTAPLALSLNTVVGDTVSINNENINATTPWMNLTVVGIAEGAWLQMMSFGRFSLAETCYISYESLNHLFPEYKDESDLFFIKIESNQDVDHIENRIRESYGSEYDLGVTTSTDILDIVRTEIDKIFVTMYSIVVFAVVNAVIGVTSIMIMNVSMRKREIGLLRSQGMSATQIITSIIGEGTTLGVVGFAVGTILGLIFNRITVSYMSLMGFPMPFIIPYTAIGLSLALTVLTSILSAAYPAYRASKLNIIDALKQ